MEEIELRSYPAKLLWFGEYTVIVGSDALAGPYHRYGGRWTKGPARLSTSIVDFLEHVSLHAEVNTHLMGQFQYQADIPPGKGLGSSGALTAALYDLCTDHAKLSRQQRWQDLGQIESYWHGKSSGFDALVSLEDTLLHRSGSSCSPVESMHICYPYVYLLDSGLERDARQLIHHFERLTRERAFADALTKAGNLVEEIISKALKSSEFSSELSDLSAYQFAYMSDFIPEVLHEPWASTLNSDEYQLKLCGAGGGGYFLLFCRREVSSLRWSGFPLLQVSVNE